MTAEDHLRALVDRGCEVTLDYDHGSYCFYCDGTSWNHQVLFLEGKKCPYVEATEYLEHQDAAREALKQLADDLQDFKPFV